MAHPEIPLIRPRVGYDIVIADGDEGAVVEESDQHQHEHWQLEEGWPLQKPLDPKPQTISYRTACVVVRPVAGKSIEGSISISTGT